MHELLSIYKTELNYPVSTVKFESFDHHDINDSRLLFPTARLPNSRKPGADNPNGLTAASVNS